MGKSQTVRCQGCRYAEPIVGDWYCINPDRKVGNRRIYQVAEPRPCNHYEKATKDNCRQIGKPWRR